MISVAHPVISVALADASTSARRWDGITARGGGNRERQGIIMNTALAGSVATTIRPTRRSTLLGRLARRLSEARAIRGIAPTLDRDEQARRHHLRQEARRLRDEQFRTGAFARLL